MLKWGEFNLDIEDGYGGVIDYTQPRPKGNICDTATSYFLLQQYIGLHDSDAKEIYEGDIIQFDGYVNAIAYVEYNEKLCAYQARNGNSGWLLAKESGIYQKVIGNIYENPGLLGV